jgi:hypothetical protein
VSQTYKVVVRFSRRFYRESTGDSNLLVSAGFENDRFQEMHSYATSPYNAAKGGNFSWALEGDTSFSDPLYHHDQELSAGSIGQAGVQHNVPSRSWQSPLPSECGSPITDDTSAFARYQQGVPPPRTKRAQVKCVLPVQMPHVLD